MARIRVYKHRPVLDVLLTAFFITELALIVKIMEFNDTLTLGACILGSAAVIEGTKRLTRVVFAKVSSSLLGAGPFRDPLSRGDNMVKFCDQMWQLVIHVAMSVFEIYVLRDERWLDDSSTVWLPRPDQQVQKQSLRLLYLVQLVSGRPRRILRGEPLTRRRPLLRTSRRARPAAPRRRASGRTRASRTASSSRAERTTM